MQVNAASSEVTPVGTCVLNAATFPVLSRYFGYISETEPLSDGNAALQTGLKALIRIDPLSGSQAKPTFPGGGIDLREGERR